ncbi:MAG TPA: type II secretion system protein GspJ [Tepidisphaeraceae bacterium]|jgi:type II secretion system protein J|nr:type II secretion system protein GspJ [Tepidisphaeraceae bacterium]
MMVRRNHSGFTLIELVLAMLLASMLALGLYRALSASIKLQRSAQAAVLAARSGSVAMDLICRDLDSAVTPAATDTTASALTNPPLSLKGPFQGSHQGAAGGDNDDLIFCTIEREDNADPNDPLAEGVRQVEFAISSNNGKSVLVRRVTRNLLATSQAPVDEQILCRDVKSFSVQYYDGTAWETSWDSTQIGDVLPYAVRVAIDIQDPSGALQANGNPVVKHMSRTIPMPCAQPSTVDSTTTATP